MPTTSNLDKIALSDAARLIGRHPRTVNRWYKWYEQFEPPDGIYLPPRHRINRSKTQYILIDDIHYLKTFSENIRPTGPWFGIMADYNALYQWTDKISNRALDNRGLTKNDIRRKQKDTT